MKTALGTIGVLFVIAWLVLWLAVKVTFGAIHILLALGVILIIAAIVRAVA